MLYKTSWTRSYVNQIYMADRMSIMKINNSEGKVLILNQEDDLSEAKYIRLTKDLNYT